MASQQERDEEQEDGVVTIPTLRQTLDALEAKVNAFEAKMDAFKAETKAETDALEARIDEMWGYFVREDRCRLRPLAADLLIAFVKRATAMLNASADCSTAAGLAKAATAINEEMYEHWGLPRQCYKLMSQNFSQIVGNQTHQSSQWLEFDLADFLLGPIWYRSRERKVLEPMFMFVYGASFEEMKSRDMKSLNTIIGSSGSLVRIPWSPKALEHSWRESTPKTQKTGGRGIGRVKW
ncbi:MAG: hypothetical protein LQ338_002617 [Usnochroma carphineum]|nr:MAG: hypothetical protein LQ338_002617 [Usnochroma carphineum]